MIPIQPFFGYIPRSSHGSDSVNGAVSLAVPSATRFAQVQSINGQIGQAEPARFHAVSAQSINAALPSFAGAAGRVNSVRSDSICAELGQDIGLNAYRDDIDLSDFITTPPPDPAPSTPSNITVLTDSIAPNTIKVFDVFESNAAYYWVTARISVSGKVRTMLVHTVKSTSQSNTFLSIPSILGDKINMKVTSKKLGDSIELSIENNEPFFIEISAQRLKG